MMLGGTGEWVCLQCICIVNIGTKIFWTINTDVRNFVLFIWSQYFYNKRKARHGIVIYTYIWPGEAYIEVVPILESLWYFLVCEHTDSLFSLKCCILHFNQCRNYTRKDSSPCQDGLCRWKTAWQVVLGSADGYECIVSKLKEMRWLWSSICYGGIMLWTRWSSDLMRR